MKKILFPFEIGSLDYKEAYVYAIKLARNFNTTLVMLNTFFLEVGNDITKEKYGRLIRDNWYKAYNEISRYNKYYLTDHARVADDLSIKFDYRFVHGIFLDEIRKAAREEDVGFLVLPLSERKEINKRQLAIISDHVFEKNRVSLLVVPCEAEYRPVKNIVFSSDLQKLNQYNLYLEDVIRLAEVLDSTIHFLHVSTGENVEKPEDTYEYRLVKHQIEKSKRHVFSRVIGKNVIESVNRYVEEVQGDLLVVVKHQHYFLDTLFHRSISNEISLNSKIPVLVMREKEY